MDTRLGYIEGWKVLNCFPELGVLMSPTQDFVWGSTVQEAKCPIAYLKDRLSKNDEEWGRFHADLKCAHGLYASRDLGVLFPYIHRPTNSKFSVLARVRGYGRVTEGDRAWRSERMEIVEACPIERNSTFAVGVDEVSGIPMAHGLSEFVAKYGGCVDDFLMKTCIEVDLDVFS